MRGKEESDRDRQTECMRKTQREEETETGRVRDGQSRTNAATERGGHRRGGGRQVAQGVGVGVCGLVCGGGR